MYVLVRHEGEGVRVGDDIVLTVDAIRNWVVTLGISDAHGSRPFVSGARGTMALAPNVRLEIVEVGTIAVKLGFDAPPTVRIRREETVDALPRPAPRHPRCGMRRLLTKLCRYRMFSHATCRPRGNVDEADSRCCTNPAS